MALNLDPSIQFTGPALPDAFIHHELEQALKGALPARNETVDLWRSVRRSLSQPLTENSGQVRVRNIILQPIVSAMGYGELLAAGMVRTRERDEMGGYLGKASHIGKVGSAHLRCWSWDYNVDLDAPIAQGLTSRYTPQRIAERVLLATREPAGLVTNGVELRLILSEASRASSTVDVSLGLWKNFTPGDPPDAFRLLVGLGSPAGVKKLPDLIDKARLNQGKVTKDLRTQARAAVEGFVQGLLDSLKNGSILENRLGKISRQKKCDALQAKEHLASQLWSEALIAVYRLLFILSGEAGTRERPPFSFSSTSLWRRTYSPSATLGPIAQQTIEQGAPSGTFLSDGLRTLFHLFEKGIQSTELTIRPLGGALFGAQAAPLIDSLDWDEASCAILLDKLLRTPRGKGRSRSLVRISYRDLDVEELGRVYEALLELEPGLTSAPMARLKRAKLEVVVPAAQGEKYRGKESGNAAIRDQDKEDEESEADEEGEEDESAEKRGKTKIEWIEAIPGPGAQHPLGHFYLRVGLGRKSSGSYYTPESFVRFLVQETCGPLCDERSPGDDPQPFEILKLNVLDPAMGSGHFLVGACRYLAERLYEDCSSCAKQGLWERIPKDLAPYMPGRQPEGESEAGLSAERARALCKRLVAVNCLYGVDKNPLAVELAKVSLWLESFAEGLPLTFLDHRLVCGDSLLGPVDILGDGPDSPMTPPFANTPMDAALTAGVKQRLRERLKIALEKVQELDATLGLDESDIAAKQRAKAELDAALRPFVDLCVAWSGGIMLGAEEVDTDAYHQAMELVARDELPVLSDDIFTTPEIWEDYEKGIANLSKDTLENNFLRMLTKGRVARVIAFPLTFPEVYFPIGEISNQFGFDAVIGNPPWDKILPFAKEFFARFDFRVIASPTKRERIQIEERLLDDQVVRQQFESYTNEFRAIERCIESLYRYQIIEINGEKTIGKQDAFRLFAERSYRLLKQYGFVGFVLPSAFHANEGATGIRQLYLSKTKMRHCFSFENKRRLFDIHSSFKYAIITAQKDPQGTNIIETAFYLHDDSWLFSESKEPLPVYYTFEFLQRTGLDYWSLLELRSQSDYEIANICFSAGDSFGVICKRFGILMGRELNMSDDGYRFTDSSRIISSEQDPRDQITASQLLSRGYLTLYEGKSIWHFDDLWEDRPRYLVSIKDIADRPDWLKSSRYFRIAFRSIASSTNERTAIFQILRPGIVTGNSAPIDKTAFLHPTADSLWLISIGNSFVFDWCLRQMVAATVNLFILERIPVPFDPISKSFFVHNATRLASNHAGYTPLWQEQLGSAWHEVAPAGTYPVLAGDDARWEVRSALDAVVVQAYGLNHEQYAHVLSTFSHKSYPKAPVLCLAKFDELNEIGLEAFTKKYDPYWDVPLVETLPQPVIELPINTQESSQISEAKAPYQTDLFGNPVQTNLFGEVVFTRRKKGRKNR